MAGWQGDRMSRLETGPTDLQEERSPLSERRSGEALLLHPLVIPCLLFF